MPMRRAECFDCKWDYGAPGFPDLLIPTWAWNKIAPHKNGIGTEGGAGLLCPNCICRRLSEAGIQNIPSAFVSGPLCYQDRDWILQGEPGPPLVSLAEAEGTK